MADIFDQISGNSGDVFDKVAQPDLIPSHTLGAIVAPELRHQPDAKRNREVMGISTPTAREDVQNSIDIFDKVAKDVAGVVTKAGAGIVSNLTLNAVNPEKGTVGIPFTDKQFQYAPPLNDALQSELGVSDTVTKSGFNAGPVRVDIGTGPGLIALAAPWGAVSRGLSALTGVVRGAVAGKTVAAAAPVAQTVAGELANIGGRVAHQATTGAVIGAAENISPEESRGERIAMTAAMGAGGQIVAEGIRGIAMAAGAAKQAAYQTLVDDLGKWAYGEGHAPTPEAAQTWAAQTVTEIVQDAGGLKNVTIRKARRAAAAVRNATKEAAPVDVSPENSSGGMTNEKGYATGQQAANEGNANVQGENAANVVKRPVAPEGAQENAGMLQRNNVGNEGQSLAAPVVSDIPVKDVFDTLHQAKTDSYGDEVMNRPGDAVTLYHGGSSDTYESILKEGIKPNKRYGLGLAEEKQARLLAQSDASARGANDDIQYKVEIPKSEITRIEKDHASNDHPEWRMYNADVKSGNIKPEWIKAVKIGRGDWQSIQPTGAIQNDLQQGEAPQVTGGQSSVSAVAQAEPQAEAVNAPSDIQTLAPEQKDSVQGKFGSLQVLPENLPPNSIVSQVNGLDGKPMGYEVTAHDGTPEGMQKAALENAQKMNAYPEASNNETIHLVTGADGKPTGQINARFGEVTPLPTAGNTSSSFADTGGYDLSRKSSIELPEIVEIARELSSGKYPHVLRKLGRRGALGLFRPGHDGKIELRADLFKTPGLAERVLAHEIGHLADWLPDMTMSRGNILGRVASLKKYMKGFLDDSASGLTPIDRKVITTELKQLTVLWKPFVPGANPAYTKYRHSSPELYADAVSVLLNDPDYLKIIAPTFERAFFEYMNRKPEVLRVYKEIQGRLQSGEVAGKRVEEVYGMFERGHAKRNELAQQKPVTESIKDTLMRGLVDERHDALKIIRSLEVKDGSPGRKGRDARIALEELPYVSSEANEAIYTIQDKILTPAEAAGISKDDLGALMFARRIVMEGGEKASALGHTAKTAQGLLDELRNQWGADKFDTAQALVDDFLKLRRDTTIQKAIDEKLFSPELIKAIEQNTDYSTNSVQKHLDADFGGQGNGITAQVYKRVGSLDEIENPFIATVMKDLSIIRAVAVNKAKRATVAAMIEGGVAEPAEMKYSQDFKRLMPVDPKDPQMAIIAYLVDGKPQFFYVAKPIADGFKSDPVRAIAFARFIANVSQPFRELFVSKNPAWMARNVSRDFLTTIKNLPEVRLRDLPELANHYRKAWAEVWREAHGKGRSDTIREMMEGKGLPTNRLWEARDSSYDDELDRIAASFDLNEAAAQGSSRATRALRKAWDWLDKTGRASDLWGKVAAYKFMQAKGSRSPEEMLRITRNRVGTPNIKRRGAWQTITNNLFMFSNVNKEGVRAGVESAKENPGAYAWKTFMVNILPRLILFAASAGYMGERTKEILARIPDYEKKQYNIIPLGTDSKDKAVYLSIPQDYEGQFFGQLTWSLLNLQVFGKEGALNSLSNINPYREHPMLQLAGSLAQYYLLDINPVDQFRGRSILSNDQAAAGGKYAAQGMGKYAWNQVGLSSFYKMTPDMPEADATALEKALKTFPLTAAGAYLKVSDRGITESINKAVEPVKRDAARERLIAKDVLKRMVEGEKVQLTDEEAQALAMHRDMVNNTVSTMTMRRQNRHLLEAISRAGSKREKAAIIQSQEGR